MEFRRDFTPPCILQRLPAVVRPTNRSGDSPSPWTYLNPTGAPLSRAGQDPKTLRYLLCLVLAYPLALVFAAIRSPTGKHAFSAAVGVFLAQFVFGDEWFHSAVSSSVAYAIMALPTRVFGSFRHNLVFLWMMGYMTAVHLYRLHVDYMGWTLDFSGPQMLLTIKLSAMGYNLYDGAVMADK